MIALTLALALATGGDTDLPRSLSLDESRFTSPEPAQADNFVLWVGGHFGAVGMYDADHPAILLGAEARAHILSWLGASATFDVQTKQKVEDAVSVFQVPFQFAGLFYPPLDLPLRPYGMFGIGWTITDVTVPGGSDESDANLLFFLGFGAEYALSKDFLLDANLRFVFAQDEPFKGSNVSADWIQFSVGFLLRLSR